MTTDLTYNERTSIAKHETDSARFSRISELFEQFANIGKGIESQTVSAVNIGREIGLELQGLCGSEQMGFSFYTTKCAQLPFSFDKVKLFISIARRAPEKVTTMEQATPILSQLYLASDLIELPEQRTNPQASHDSTPVTFVFHTLGVAWNRIEDKMKDSQKWDAMTRSSVRTEIERFEKKAAELKQRL